MATPSAPTSHPFNMHTSIFKQPDAIASVFAREKDKVLAFAKKVELSEQIHIVGIGTSWHGTLVTEYLLRIVGGRHDARAWNSFEFVANPPVLSSKAVVIVFSHRGTKQFSLQSLQLAKKSGSVTALVTGIGSPIDESLCDAVFRTCEQENSSAFTWSHTTCMAIMLMLAVELGRTPVALAMKETDLSKDLVACIKAALLLEGEIQAWVKKVVDYKVHYIVGHGINVSTGYETALKIKETSYVMCEGFQVEQYLHGPFCATDSGVHVIFIDHTNNNPGHARTQEMADGALHVGAFVSTIANVPGNDRKLDKNVVINLPNVSELFSPFADLVVLQLFTYWLAIEKNCNPDVFRTNDPLHAEAKQKRVL